MRTYLYIGILLMVSACQQNNDTAATIQQHEGLAAIFKTIDAFSGAPEDSLYRGKHPTGKWSSNSFEARTARADSLQLFVNQLEAIVDGSLSAQEKISKSVMLIRLRDQIDDVKYKMILIPFNAEGGFYNQLSYSLARLPFKTAKDYYDYLAWLPNYQTVLEENMALMKKGMEEGIVAPEVIVNNTLELLKPWVIENYEQSIFYTPIIDMPESVGAEDKEKILEQSKDVIGKLLATYKTVQYFFANEYKAAAAKKPGIAFVPGGKEYYENRVRHYTTLPLTPDSIHALGLSEVARIRNAMDDVMKEVKFKGSYADFLQFLRTDKQFYPNSPQELLNYASWLSKKAEGKLPKYFRTLYSLPFTVEPVPDNIAPTYTAGRYVEGSWESKRAGIYWVNTYDLKSRTLYTLPALTLHEAVPGHHLQGAIAAEIKNIPAFRNQYYISAFGEGWALYCEYLGEEMGMYSTPYELFGRYTYEMWRACRLVVDTGIHYKGWSREEALKYLGENTALSIHEVTTEIDRYIGWPGQALSYKVGELKIKDLRKKSEDALGNKFDIASFHQVILQNGSIPLMQLEAQVDAYIKDVMKK